jgi:hypothetical protein
VADSACCLCYFDVVRNGSLWVLDVAVAGSVLSSSLVMFVGAALVVAVGRRGVESCSLAGQSKLTF